MSRTDTTVLAVRTMAIARGALGLALYVAPDRSTRILGLDPESNCQLRIPARAFGARDLALAVGLLAEEGRSRRALFFTCVAVEAFDTLTVLIARHSGTISAGAAAKLLGAIAAAAIPEVVAVAADSRR